MAVSLKPGLVLSINNEDVLLTGTTSAEDAALKGIKFRLAHPVLIGSAANLSEFLKSQFGSNALPSPDSLPEPLKTAFKALSALDLRVEEFDMTIPPTKELVGTSPVATDITNPKRRTFSLGLSATWASGEEFPVPFTNDKLKIKGAYMQVSDDGVPATPAPAPGPR